VCAEATQTATWNSGVLTVQVSPDGVVWLTAVYVNGGAVGTLTANGVIDGIYVGDVRYVRLATTTAASAATSIEVRWP
jgi:hypothetical protein